MKNLILITLMLLTYNSFAGTCTAIERLNAASLSVLSSSTYNTDHNTAYTAINAFDAGCITSGTLEADALNATDFAPMLKGIKEGCKVTRSNASTVSIDKCLAAVNGNFVTTTVATTASFGCGSCSAEVASTNYYVYIANGSTGTTLTPLISTTAPNGDGYDNSNNKVIGRFYNNASSDIDQYSIDQWQVNEFKPQDPGMTSAGTIVLSGVTTSPVKGTIVRDRLYFKRYGDLLYIHGDFEQSTGGSSGSGTYLIPLPNTFYADLDKIDATNGSATVDIGTNTVGTAILSTTASSGIGTVRMYTNTYMAIFVAGTGYFGSGAFGLGAQMSFSFHAWIPLAGWEN